MKAVLAQIFVILVASALIILETALIWPEGLRDSRTPLHCSESLLVAIVIVGLTALVIGWIKDREPIDKPPS
jgi:hypothetical protein